MRINNESYCFYLITFFFFTNEIEAARAILYFHRVNLIPFNLEGKKKKIPESKY